MQGVTLFEPVGSQPAGMSATLKLSALNDEEGTQSAALQGHVCKPQSLTPLVALLSWSLVMLVSQVIPYYQRISLLLYKLREAATALGSQQNALALGYAASTMHDVAALHK